MPHSSGWRRRKDARSDDPVSIGDVVEGLLGEQAFARGMPIARLASQWAAIVGGRLAAETAPMSLEQGILTIGTTNGPWGAQARFLDEEIRRRANEALGGEPIRAVRIVVRNTR